MNALILILAATLYTVEPTNGSVSFNILKWGVVREEGSFRDFRATIDYDKANPAKSRVDFEVRVKSIDTKNENRDETLLSRDFFDADRHPTLTFRSVRVVPRSATVADVTGDLTIRGVTRRITVPVRLLGISRRGKIEVAGFETAFTINRRAFGVNGDRWSASVPGILDDNVQIRITAGGTRRP